MVESGNIAVSDFLAGTFDVGQMLAVTMVYRYVDARHCYFIADA